MARRSSLAQLPNRGRFAIVTLSFPEFIAGKTSRLAPPVCKSYHRIPEFSAGTLPYQVISIVLCTGIAIHPSQIMCLARRFPWYKMMAAAYHS